LIILGLFPKLAALVASIPQPVLGGVGNVPDIKKTEAVPSPNLT
jgi:hypothetical protein